MVRATSERNIDGSVITRALVATSRERGAYVMEWIATTPSGRIDPR